MLHNLAASNLVEVAEIVNRLLWRRCKPGFAEARVQCGQADKAKQTQKQAHVPTLNFEVAYSSLLKSWKRKLFDV
jgi:hypothetical protein